ncbi:MAG: divergent polysaccharide deacetylase family protein [Deltaproteobacteria bacterium]|nr:divergent polysaccharide deacetylase family protein [Deltaproteobacteria bacterium]
MELNLPLALSILPRAPFTREVAQEAVRRGIPLMLHLPMEPRNYPETRPGPGALLLCMSREEILKVVDEDLARVPGAVGVNNHMGSLFTEDREKMGIVLGELKRRNLFFVDSRTTKRSVAYTLAKEMGLPALQRQVFLDNRASKSEVRIQLDRLRSIAGRSGRALGIGHPHKETLETLEEDAAWLQKAAQVVPVEALLGEAAKGVRR